MFSLTLIIVLTVLTLLTATLSGIIGMGGGILLLAALLSFLGHGEAVPLHGAVQLVSNGSRAVAFLRDVDWRTVGRFASGLVPGVAAAWWLYEVLGKPEASEPYLKLLIGLYVLVAGLAPLPKGRPRDGTGVAAFLVLGVVAGLASITVGATGPLIAPLFARHHFVKERLIATKAMCQMASHLLKLPVFWMLGTVDFAGFSLLLFPMGAAALVGTLLGKRILRHVEPATFVKLYRLALVVAGAKVLLVDGLRPLLARL